MSISSRQIGWSSEASLLHTILRQVERLTQVIGTSSGGATTLGALTDVNLTAPIPGDVLVFNGSEWVNAPAGGAPAAGANTQVQYNNGGVFGASPNFTFTGNALFLVGKHVITNNVDSVNILLAKPDATTNPELQLFGGVWNSNFDNSSGDQGVRLGGAYIALESSDISIQLNSAQVGSRVIVAGLTERGNAILGVEAPPIPDYVASTSNNIDVAIYGGGAVPSPWVDINSNLTVTQDIDANTGDVSFEVLIENTGTKSGTFEIGVSIDNLPPTAANSIAYTISTGVKQLYASTITNSNFIPTGTLARLQVRVVVASNPTFIITAINSERPGLLQVKVLGSGGGSDTITVGTTAILAGTSGHIPFNNAGVYGESPSLFWDNTNSRLGIGTVAPTATLHVVSNVAGGPGMKLFNPTLGVGETLSYAIGKDFNAGNSGFFGWVPTGVNTGYAFIETFGGTMPLVLQGSGGNVGIGTTNPIEKLQVAGNTFVTGRFVVVASQIGAQVEIHPNINSVLAIGNTLANSDPYMSIAVAGVTKAVIGWNNGANGLGIGANGGVSTHLLIKADGNVGIGTLNATSRLTIYATTTSSILELQAVAGLNCSVTMNATTGFQPYLFFSLNGDGYWGITRDETAFRIFNSIGGRFVIGNAGNIVFPGLGGSGNTTAILGPGGDLLRTSALTFDGSDNAVIEDGKNLFTGLITGTQIGGSNLQKLALWGATPVIQPTSAILAEVKVAIGGTAINENDTFGGYTMGQIVAALKQIGALA